MENWGKASRICFTLEKEKRLRNRPAPTLNLLVNPSNSGLKLSIFAWRMGIMRLIRFYLRERKNYCLLVLTDRKSRHQIIRLIPNKSAEVVNQALKLILKQHKILSITADNGTEFNRLSNVFSEEHIYYAHPYASWERGTNENHNRLIRRWLPKGTKKMTPKEVAFIEKWINNYPKKCLDYKSPREDFWMANLNLKFSKMEIIFY